ncbi:hypothetical protein NVT87_00905 [Acinetobacter radioresistens]|jgi:hypothetical protein|uniref:Suppressor of fused-like domain-containing protein n=1 Tax=Acinetobacter radioresistens SK82 TaxID=596318 RepID=A0ABP2GJU9_ACIRA|nr:MULTISPECIES: hypothetical protein [Acinetobacter]EET81939.1 hypothetical protein ACIRA0001_2071 [Acinetobacter radioresistens SK82]EXE59930.1 hypothetical protein J579_0696 [Acinetobacter sp. 1239920]MCK4085633.1 hypothetical protein [Acinetobacter radioresistens]MCX0329452.1 hypothetical protein [Acinetobacter radioresistens]QMU06541.1 hypothetical protein FOC39_06690 [Acinetobacter radioresistens]
MVKTRTEINQESNERRGIVNKAFKLHQNTVDAIRSFADDSEKSQAQLVTNAFDGFYTPLPAGYENQDGEDISSDIYIYHHYGLETWLIITNVRDDYNEEREIDLDEINFEDMVNHFISQHLPGLHINHIKIFYTPVLGSGEFYRPNFSKLKQEMYKDSVSFFFDLFHEMPTLFRYKNLHMVPMEIDSKEYEKLAKLY